MFIFHTVIRFAQIKCGVLFATDQFINLYFYRMITSPLHTTPFQRVLTKFSIRVPLKPAVNLRGGTPKHLFSFAHLFFNFFLQASGTKDQ
jgi:hypothetical protein